MSSRVRCGRSWRVLSLLATHLKSTSSTRSWKLTPRPHGRASGVSSSSTVRQARSEISVMRAFRHERDPREAAPARGQGPRLLPLRQTLETDPLSKTALPPIKAVAPGIFTPAKGKSDDPKDEKNGCRNPQKMHGESSTEENQHQESQQEYYHDRSPFPGSVQKLGTHDEEQAYFPNASFTFSPACFKLPDALSLLPFACRDRSLEAFPAVSSR